MTVPVRCCQGAGDPGPYGAGEVHGHRPRLALLVYRPGLLKQLLRVRRAGGTDPIHIRSDAAPPVTVGKAGAGKGRLQLRRLGGGGRPAFPKQPVVDPGDHGHILRPLHAALQLQAGHAQVCGLLQRGGHAVVLEAQGIGVPRFPAHRRIGQTAGLGTAAPVPRAAADQSAHGALAGVAHAKSPVGEDLHLGGTVLADGGGVGGGALPGQHHPLAAVLRQQAAGPGGKGAHLGAGMDRQLRQHPPQQEKQPPVLDQHRVHARSGGLRGSVQGPGQLPVRHQGIEGQKDPHAPLVTVEQGVGKFGVRKILGALAGVEGPPAQVHRVGPVLHGGAQGLRRAGGGEQLRPHPLFWWSRRCCRRKTSRLSSLTSAWALVASSM